MTRLYSVNWYDEENERRFKSEADYSWITEQIIEKMEQAILYPFWKEVMEDTFLV